MRALFALVITLLFGCVIQENDLKSEFQNYRIRIVDPLLRNFDTCEATFLDNREKRYYNGIGENYQQVFRQNLVNYQTFEYHCLRNIRKPFFHIRRTLAFDENFERNDLKMVSRKERCSDRNKEKTKIFNVNCGRETRKDDPDYWDDDVDSATEEEEEEDTEKTDSNEWDTWTEWSECSASCGCGRQVRWQHCIGKGCAFGLKRAQIRTCHLRDCNAKNLFSWLGVKP